MSKYAIIGHDRETGQPITIGDIERRSGLYILGKPGMGKSALMVNLMIQDTKNGHGIFFLDPHEDAIDALVHHGPYSNMAVYSRLFNPQDETHSFGINLLACDDVTSLKERTDTYTRAYNVFYKLWENEWGPWLQLILQNTLWAFIENPEYTLAEVPMFLNPRNTAFRTYILSNVKYNPAVLDFWRYEFFQRREREQQERVDAALTRVTTLLTHPYIRHIVGQRETTIWFDFLLCLRPVLLFKLSANLAPDIKKFIGTILISELLHAIRKRPEDKRTQFCIFVDEFQNFASSEDFKTLITEARKFGVATTIAHQERFGQFSEDKKIQGATAAAANKVFFQTTVKDAQELAPEFAEKAGDIKTLVGGELIISPRAVEDIWEKGHPNKYIMDIRKRYFWLVNLVQSNPKETYFQFDPTNLPQTNPLFKEVYKDEYHPNWGSFDDWGMYRSSADMIKRGLALLDEYYYDWMQQKRSESDPITDREVQQVLKIVECFSGVFGFRPTMEPYIPDEMRRAYMHRFAEQRGRAIEKAIQEYRRMEAENRRHGIYKSSYPYPDLPTSEDKYVKQTAEKLLEIDLSDIPSRLTTKFVQTWRNFAIKRGFSQYELEQFIQWRIRPLNPLEEELLTGIVKSNMKIEHMDSRMENIILEYQGVMLLPMLRDELGFEFEDQLKLLKNKGHAIPYEMLRQYETFHKKIRPLLSWQFAGLQGLVSLGIYGGGRMLKREPVKVPSGKYDETPKRERTQAEMIDVMAQELTNLLRFTAYAKIIQEKGGGQTVWKGPITMLTLPPHQEPPIVEGEKQPEIASDVIKKGHSFCKERTQIEEEIRQRQEWWRGSVSDEPPPTHD
jgi:hypothetical protein